MTSDKNATKPTRTLSWQLRKHSAGDHWITSPLYVVPAPMDQDILQIRPENPAGLVPTSPARRRQLVIVQVEHQRSGRHGRTGRTISSSPVHVPLVHMRIEDSFLFLASEQLSIQQPTVELGNCGLAVAHHASVGAGDGPVALGLEVGQIEGHQVLDVTHEGLWIVHGVQEPVEVRFIWRLRAFHHAKPPVPLSTLTGLAWFVVIT